MNEIETVKKMLEVYIEASTPVTQEFYQGLCIKADEMIKKLETALIAVSKNEDGCRKRGVGHNEIVDHIVKTALGQI